MLTCVVSIFFVLVPLGVAQNQNPELQSAIQLIKEKKSSQAIAALKSITSKDQQDAVAWYYLGLAYLQKPDVKKATAAFEKATNLKADMSEAFTGLGYCYLRLGKLDVAKGATERSLSIQPVSADAHYTLGVINLRMGNRDESLKNAEAAIKERPTMSEAYLLKAQSLVYFVSSVLVQVDQVKEERLSRYRQAAAALEKYLELVPESDDKLLWKEQLASLRVHSELSENEVFTGRQVRQKFG
jgi:tetratricopeptide (TPR) repeat protein